MTSTHCYEGNLVGEFGMGVDNIISLRVVLASGDIVTVSRTSFPDLFWAMRGAGPNFGIVISMTVNAMPATSDDCLAYIGNLIFSPGKIEEVAQAIQDLPLTKQQRVFFYLASSGPPSNEPCIMVNCFLHKGTEETGRAAFAPLHALGPMMEMCSVESFDKWNDSGDIFCLPGGRKPAYSTSINHMQPRKWLEIWDLYKQFQSKAPNSAILIERFNMAKSREVSSGSVSWNEALRHGAFAQAIVIPWYDDATLDPEAEDFAQSIRALWSYSEDPKNNPV